MALNKAIKSGKEYRKLYTGSKAIDKTCRNHGTCIWCQMNRTYKYIKTSQKALDRMKEWCYT